MKSYKYRAFLPIAGDCRRFCSLTDAERFARSQCARSGDVWRLESMADGSNGQIIAAVSRDYANRVWTDVAQIQGSLL